MKKEKLVVPANIRYIQDWSNLEGGYDLSKFNFPHILDKKITGCGFTEYCLRNNMNIILCSPRRILLENKASQHENEMNIYYFKNEGEVVNFDKDLTITKKENSFRSNKVNLIKSEEDQLTEEETSTLIDSLSAKTVDNAKRIEELKESLKSRVWNMQGVGCKILVTYDSFRLVKEALQELNMLQEFFVVVDEFQSIFVDSRFKSNTEIELLDNLRGIQKLCYVSATPTLDKYLEMLEEFKDLPYFEFDWVSLQPGRIYTPDIDPFACRSVIYAIDQVIHTYLNGEFEECPVVNKDGSITIKVSNEAVIYVNSVKNITDIIKRNNLSLENTNVLCSRTESNEAKVRRAFKDAGNSIPKGIQAIGIVPKRGEHHKMFTLCTRTVYLGADFYSTCARTFIVSDANIDSLAVDITLDLPQIMGRQRLDENPWKNHGTLFYKTLNNGKELTPEEFMERILIKRADTEKLLAIYYEDVKDSGRKHVLVKNYQRTAILDNYKDNYVAVNVHAGSDLVPTYNKLIEVSELRAYDVQQQEYRSRASVVNSIMETGFDLSSYNKVLEVIDQFYKLTLFTDKMKLVCNTGFPSELQENFLRQLPMIFGNYYHIVGPEKIRALSYKRSDIKSVYDATIKLKSVNTDLPNIILSEFEVGKDYSKAVIKEKLGRIYETHNIEKVPKATDLKDYFNMKETIKTIDGLRIASYRILDIR